VEDNEENTANDDLFVVAVYFPRKGNEDGEALE